MTLFELAMQYGLAGLALYMMYNITYNHLKTIEDLLVEIRDKL
jgi:hypothetical protein